MINIKAAIATILVLTIAFAPQTIFVYMARVEGASKIDVWVLLSGVWIVALCLAWLVFQLITDLFND